MAYFHQDQLLPLAIFNYDWVKERKVELLLLAIFGPIVGRFILGTIFNVLFHPLKEVPGPWLGRIFENYLTPAQIALHRSQTLKSLHDQYGSVVRVGPNEVSIADWTAYREIYNNRTSTKLPSFYHGFQSTGRHESSFSMQDKAEHMARRKIQNPSHSQKAILENELLIEERADVLVRRITNAAKESKSGTTAEIYELNGLFTLEVILKCGFNRSYGNSPNGDSQTLLRAMDGGAIATQICGTIPFINRKFGLWLPGFLGQCFRECALWESMTKVLSEEFRQQEAAADTTMKFMVTPMLMNEDSYLGRRLTEDELLEELMAFTFGGSGTTSTTLTYLIYSLAQNPTIQDRLRDELLTVEESLTELQGLPFLDAVIKETFRLYPTIMSTLPRVLDRPIQICKYYLPEGTIVGMQNYVHHRDPNLFPCPDDFIPQRWLADEDKTKDMNMAWTPFSVGARNCIGQNLAKAELFIATSKIFRRLRVTLNPMMTDRDMEMEDRFNIAPKGRRLLVDVKVLN